MGEVGSNKKIILFKYKLGYCNLQGWGAGRGEDRVSRELPCLRPEQEGEAKASEQNILLAVNSRWALVPLTSLTSGHSEG